MVLPTLGRNEEGSWLFPQVYGLPPGPDLHAFPTWVCPHSPTDTFLGATALLPQWFCHPSDLPSHQPLWYEVRVFPSHRPPLCFPKITRFPKITQSVQVFARWCCYLRSTQRLLPPEASRVRKKQRLRVSVGAWSP